MVKRACEVGVRTDVSHTDVSASMPPNLPSRSQQRPSEVTPSDKVKSLSRPITWDSCRNPICLVRGVYLPLASAHIISRIDFVQLPKIRPIHFSPHRDTEAESDKTVRPRQGECVFMECVRCVKHETCMLLPTHTQTQSTCESVLSYHVSHDEDRIRAREQSLCRLSDTSAAIVFVRGNEPWGFQATFVQLSEKQQLWLITDSFLPCLA